MNIGALIMQMKRRRLSQQRIEDGAEAAVRIVHHELGPSCWPGVTFIAFGLRRADDWKSVFGSLITVA